MKPYTEKLLSENKRVRKFSSDVDPMLLEWHQDKRDRVVKVLEGTGWKFQLDDSVPVNLSPGSTFNVPAFTWHRIIKGEDDLVIKITEAKFKKGDKVKWSGGKGVVKVPNARGDLVGVDPEGGDEMDMVPEKDLSLVGEAKLTRGYKANRSKKSQDKLKALIDRYNKAKKTPGKGDDLAAIKARDAFEKTQKNTGKKSKHNYQTKKEGVDRTIRLDEGNQRMIITELIDMMADELLERKKISQKVHKALKKKAKDRNAPLGALKAIYRKGMGAFYSSGSRSGQNPHSWAMGRVNSVLRGGKARSVDKAQWKSIQKHRKKKRGRKKK